MMKKSRPPPQGANMGRVGRSVLHSKDPKSFGLSCRRLERTLMLKSREMRYCPAEGEWTKLLKRIKNVCIFKVTVYVTIYTFMWFIWLCYFRCALYHNRYELSLCLLQVTDVTDVCLRWSNEMSGGGLARSLQRFNEPGELSASAGGAVDALPGAV